MFPNMWISGYGAVIRNEKGEVMATYSARGPTVVDSEETEVLACHKALEFAVDAAFFELINEGDNFIVMKAISSTRVNCSYLGHVYEDIRCIATGLRRMSISCVQHSENAVAHSLARFAREIENEVVWLGDSPPPALEARIQTLYYYECMSFGWAFKKKKKT